MGFWGGLFGIGGDLAGAAMSASQARAQRRWQSRENVTNRAFQERMYGSRYQMQMDDMRAGGLNPILSYATGAGGAPAGNVGSGAMGQVNLRMGSDAVASAIAAQKAIEELKQIKSGTRLQNANARLSDANAHKAELIGRGYGAGGKAADIAEDIWKPASAKAKKLGGYLWDEFQWHRNNPDGGRYKSKGRPKRNKNLFLQRTGSR